MDDGQVTAWPREGPLRETDDDLERATIFAVSTAPGRAGIAVVRVSGPRAHAALRALGGGLPAVRAARLATLRAPETGEVLDQALVLRFDGPASETGEDIAEFHIHGSHAVAAGVLGALGGLPGLRPAEAGEFARRAFDNGKLDLSAVEGLADLIGAETAGQRRQALRQMSGALARRVEDWSGRLVRLLAHAEAAIDFADEDLPPALEQELAAGIPPLMEEMAAALARGDQGERLRSGLVVAIVGAPNVGKSTLLNALAARDVAIVSDVPGTTRDALEVHLDLGGYPVTLVDTAGLRGEAATEGEGGQGAVEREGMRRARALAARADLKLAVLDAGAAEPDAATQGLIDAGTLVVYNKADIAAAPGDGAAVAVSALTGQGLPALLERLTQAVRARFDAGGEAPLLTRARHRAALADCVESLARARSAAAVELLAEDLRLAVRALGRIVGRVDVEDVLDVVFADFCIGK